MDSNSSTDHFLRTLASGSFLLRNRDPSSRDAGGIAGKPKSRANHDAKGTKRLTSLHDALCPLKGIVTHVDQTLKGTVDIGDRYQR